MSSLDLEPIAMAAENFFSETAIITRDIRWSFADLAERTALYAASFAVLGMRPGRRIVIQEHVSAALVVMLLGGTRTGALVCDVESKAPVPALIDMARMAVARLVVSRLLDVEGLDLSCHVVHPESLPKGGQVPSPRFIPSRPVLAVATSGSSGTPKIAALSARAMMVNALASNANLPFIPGDRWLLSVPLHHVSGLAILFRALAGGGAVAIPEPGQTLAESITALGATHLSVVPTQLHRLLASEEGTRALAGLKAILLGGAIIPTPLLLRCAELGLPVSITYGMSEAGSQIATTPYGRAIEPDRHAAPVLPGVEMTLDSEGLILLKGDTLFAGYLDGLVYRLPLTQDGWFETGDLGVWDNDGWLRVTGRRDNLFKSGGEIVSPEEIERHILQLSGVTQAVVVPFPDMEYGHRPVAFVRLESGESPSSVWVDMAMGKLREQLPGYRVPRVYLPFADDISQEGGKPSRPALTAKAVDCLK